jgi:hypothetical protein
MVTISQNRGKRLSPLCHRRLLVLARSLNAVRQQMLVIESAYPDLYHDARLNLPELDAVTREVLRNSGKVMKTDIDARVADLAGGVEC